MAINIGPRIGVDGEAEYRKQLKDIIAETKTLNSEMKKLESTFSKDTSVKEKNQKRTELLTKQQELLKKRVDECRKGVEQATQKYGENSETTQKWKQALNNAETELNQVNAQLKDTSGINAWKAGLDEMSGKLKSIGDGIRSAGKTMSVAITAPLVALGTKGAMSFAEVDKTMQLTNSTMQNTAEEAAALNRAMQKAAANSTFGMSDAATATLNFARAGLNAKEAADALAPSMNLAAGEGGNLDTVSAGLVATINSFGDSFDQTSHYADVFASACNNSALDVDSLSESMSIAAPVFAAAGYKVEDAALMMGVMANAGISSSEAANALKTGLARLISPAEDAALKMDELGIKVTNADDTMKSTIEIQSMLHDSFASLSESEQLAAASTIFGKNHMAKWLALINTAPDDVMDLSVHLDGASLAITSFSDNLEKTGITYDDIKNRMAQLGISADAVDTMLLTCQGSASLFAEGLWEAADQGVTFEDVLNNMGISLSDLQLVLDATKGTTDVMAEAMMSGFGGSLEKLKSSIDVASTSLGETLAPKILLVSNKIQQAVDWFNSLDATQKDNIVTIGLVVAAIGPALVIIGTLISTIGNVISVVGTVGTALSGVALGPIAVAVAAIGGLVAAGVLLYQNWDTIKAKAAQIFESIRTTISNAITKIKSLFNFSWSFPKPKMPHFSWYWQNLGGLVSIPMISIDWYAKAMKDGMILNQPTIFGMSGGKLLGGGEAGSETVVGTGSLMSMIRQTVQETMGYVPSGDTTNYGGVTVNVYGAPGQDVDELANIIEERITHSVERRGNAW